MTTSPATPASLTLPEPALEALEIGLCLVDGAGVVRDWSGMLARQGIPRDDALDRDFRTLAARLWPDPAERTRIAGAIAQARATGATLTLESAVAFPARLHEMHTVTVTPSLNGGSNSVALLFQPASDATRVRRHFERILDSARDGIMVIDPDRRVRLFNRACAELLGKDAEEVLRTNCVCGEVVHCHMADGTSILPTSLCPARGLFQGETTDQVTEMLVTTESGEERWVETHYSSINGADGRPEFVIGVLRDVHERKLLEQRLAQTEKLAALGHLIAGVAHEIKNPLGILLSSVELILDDKRPRETHREAAQYIKDEVQRLDNRLRGFLAFARPSPAHPEPVVLGGAVHRVVQGVELASPGVEMSFQPSCPDPIVQLDPDHLAQVLTNLLLNAVEAMNGSGRVLVGPVVTETAVRIEVHDSGPGVSDDIRARIFDPFYTTKATGTGLGLSVAVQLCAGIGGSLEVERSELLGGALFVVVLPYRSAE